MTFNIIFLLSLILIMLFAVAALLLTIPFVNRFKSIHSR